LSEFFARHVLSHSTEPVPSIVYEGRDEESVYGSMFLAEEEEVRPEIREQAYRLLAGEYKE
jgi:hypothetical protein